MLLVGIVLCPEMILLHVSLPCPALALPPAPMQAQDSHADGATQGESEGDGEGLETEVVDADTGATVKNKYKGNRSP
jgi:hypothetical protein